MKRFPLSFAFFGLCGLLFATEPSNKSSEKLNIGILNGPSAIPAAYIIENNPEFSFQLFSGADSELPKLVKGELDVGILPPNAAAKIYNKSKGQIVALAVVGEMNLSLLTTDPDYKNLKSLKGKTVFCAGRGATPDYIFRAVLEKHKIKVAEDGSLPKKDSVSLDFSVPNPELAGSLISGKARYIFVPEPFATVAIMKGKEAGVRKIYSPLEDFPESFPMTLLVCNADSHRKKQSEIDGFLEIYREAVRWTKENPTDAGLLTGKHTLGLNAKVSEASIPNGNYVFVPAKQAESRIRSLLDLFLKENEESIGGKLPEKDFYK